MNSSVNSDIQLIDRALATLRQKVEEILKIAPDLMKIDSLEELPKDTAKVTEDKLWSIFTYGEYFVEKLMSDLPAPMLTVESKKEFDYYNKTYKPISKKITKLIDVSDAPTRREVEIEIGRGIFPADPVTSQTDIDEDIGLYESLALDGRLKNYIKYMAAFGSSTDRLQNSFLKVFSAAHDYLHRRIEKDAYVEDSELNDHLEGLEFALSGCENIRTRPYFKPDDWVANEKDLDPIIVTTDMEKIPTHVKNRIHEIYDSFIFGNWMSVIALSRCLLEYALIDRKNFLKIDVYDNNHTKPLWKLVKQAESVVPALSDSMHTIKKHGNEILHPPSDSFPDNGKVVGLKKVRTLIPPGKDMAKICVIEINKIISTLYSH